jgi:hypothetical protein
MQEFTVVNGPVALSVGTEVFLNKKQFDARAHNLKLVGEGLYKVMKSIQFKNGEKIGFKEMPSKKTLSAFYSPEEIKKLNKKALKEKNVINKNKE